MLDKPGKKSSLNVGDEEEIFYTIDTSLISPETPRPRKSYALQYQNGTAYTYLVIF
jgi:hypothetical protein